MMPEHRAQQVLTELQKKGICQIKPCEVKLTARQQLEFAEEIYGCSNRLEALKSNIARFRVLEEHSKLTHFFFPKIKKPVRARTISNSKLVAYANKTLERLERFVMPRVHELKELEKQYNKNRLMLRTLWYLPNVPLSIFRSMQHLNCIVGFIDAKKAELVRKKLKHAVVGITLKGKNRKLVAVYHLRKDAESTQSALHELGFERVELPSSEKNVAEYRQILREENKRIKQRIDVLNQELRKFVEKQQATIEELDKTIKAALQRLDAANKMAKSHLFSVLEAWVPERNVEEMIKVLEKNTPYFIEMGERDDAPTIFDNPKPFKPFELLTQMYAVPKYKHVDPTPVLAIFFSIFFGFMLTDFFYGLMLCLVGALLYRGIGKVNETMRKFSLILVYAGVATATLGIIFGSYFGNFFLTLGINMPAILDTMRDAVTVIAFAILLAATHVMIGLVLGFKENWAKGRKLEAFREQATWILFLLGSGAFLMPVDGAIYIGSTLIVGAVLMLVGLNAISKGPVVAGLSVLDFPSFVGDIFSYTRLTAMAIATTGIALAVNFLVFLALAVPYVGLMLGALVFIIGHIFNFGMNFLGAFIHSMRLHFLEFFKRFYEGGGELYKPFKIEEVE
jgi:V/A-type H+-transporting ATPase subunit I